jgi:2-haloacid dehalogenase
MTTSVDTILFDLGKVLLDWDPRYFYRRFFPDDEAGLERFLAEAITHDWVQAMDRGQPLAEAVEQQAAALPQHAALIRHWPEGWPQMLRGEISGSVAILDALDRAGYPLYALTNFSTETWPIAVARCPVLQRFRHVVISGEIGLVKPEPAIYTYTVERCALSAARTLFIDDLSANVAGARAAGLQAVRFTDPSTLQRDLLSLGVRLA